MTLVTWETLSLSEVTLPSTEIHLWRVPLNTVSWATPLRVLLAADECARADRFLQQRDRHRFTIARGMLRVLLSHYLSQPASSITFSYGEYGKPRLASGQLPSEPLYFNLSHSQDLALYGFCRSVPLGIDIEMMREMRDIDQIAQRFFSPQEAAVVCQLTGAAKQQGFFNCWTRKEAFIKAIGKGVFFGLDRFAVRLAPGESPELLWIADDPDGPGAWQLRSFSPAPDYLAALAFPTGHYQLRFYDLPSRLVELL